MIVGAHAAASGTCLAISFMMSGHRLKAGRFWACRVRAPCSARDGIQLHISPARVASRSRTPQGRRSHDQVGKFDHTRLANRRLHRRHSGFERLQRRHAEAFDRKFSRVTFSFLSSNSRVRACCDRSRNMKILSGCRQTINVAKKSLAQTIAAEIRTTP